MLALIARFRGSAFAKDTAILTLGTVGAQFLMIASMPVMSRLYSPADFGLLALFMAVSSIMATAVTLRYETAILLPKQEQESIAIVLLSLVLAISLGTSFGITAWLIPGKLKGLLGVSQLRGWLPIAAVAALASAVVATGTAWLNRQRAYSAMAQIRILHSAVAVTVGIVLGLTGAAEGLLVAQIVALLVVSGLIIARLSPLFAHWDHRAVIEAASQHRAAPKFLLPTALLDVVTMQLPVLLITAWFSSESAGQFNMAWRILALPMTLIGAAVGQVFFQRFSQAWPDPIAARSLLVKTWVALGLIGFLPTVTLMFLGKPIFMWVLGDAWREAGIMATIIAPMLLAILISSPTSTTFLVLGLQKYSLVFGFAFLLYRSGCIYFGALYDKLLLGIGVWVFCEIIAIISYNFIVLRCITRHEIHRCRDNL